MGATSDEGIKLVLLSRPDLVLLDIMLPGMDGIEVLKRIRAINPSIAVIMVMGDAMAAKIVERFSELVREAAARFDGRIVDRVGDAFLLVFPDPRAAVMCAREIEQRTAAEPQFPAVRGAVHWGDMLYQESGYVGGTLNIASRVATQAAPHQILATAAARSEIGSLAGFRFAPLGKRQLKGLADEVEVFEVRSGDVQRSERARDPVCGIEMAPGEIAATLLVNGQEVAFCCEKCLRRFLDAPLKHGE